MEVVVADPGGQEVPLVLRAVARRVDPADPEVDVLVARLRSTLEASGGVGLAAPQVGIPARVVLVKHGTRPQGQPTHVEVYLNPVLEWESAELDEDWEGCLSVPGVGGLVSRPRAVRVSHDRPGGRAVVELDGWDARIMQHELDHLVGVLYVDHALGPLLPVEEARRRRDVGHRDRGWLAPDPASIPASAPAAAP
jgi:peptide deformylase